MEYAFIENVNVFHEKSVLLSFHASLLSSGLNAGVSRIHTSTGERNSAGRMSLTVNTCMAN